MYILTMGVVNKTLTLLKEERNAEYRSGSVNIDKIVFNFSGEEWENLTKIAVFITESGKVIDVPLIGNYCVVPSEVYITSHTDLRDVNFYYDMVVGIYGQYIDQETNKVTKILPTNLVRRKVRLGSYFPGVTPSELPTAEQWQIYIDEVGSLASRAEAAEEICVALEKDIKEIYDDIKEIQTNVINLEERANNSAQNASNYMNSAYDYANNASNYANNSLSYANNSSNFANSAYEHSQNASNFANNARSFSEAALNYANNSQSYSQNALGYSNNAKNSASNASNYATNASLSANNASNFANNAGIYANNAKNYANNSYNSAILSGSYANNASYYMNQSQDYSNQSQSYSNDAHNYSNSANTANNNAQNIYNQIWDISAARMFAAFDVNPINGDLIMTTVQSLGNIGFSLDTTSGDLVITLS